MANKITLLGVILWIVGLLVALAIGSAMASGILTVPYVSDILSGWIVKGVGWVVIVGTLLGALLSIINAVK